MSYDVSVVVPVYNAEKYIRSCVDSALNQTLKNIEVIIVDDCSTDNSLNLCRELYGNNDRVKIFQQPVNHGPGAARNAGIREASGEYIAFLDSDDEIMPEHLQNMFTAAKEHDADVIHNNRIWIMLPLEDGTIPVEMLDHPESIVMCKMDKGERVTDVKTITSDLNQRFDLWTKGGLHCNVCNKMFRRSLITENSISFPEAKLPEGTMLSEDELFCLQCILTAKNYVFTPRSGYILRFNPTSSTRVAKTVTRIVNALGSQLEVIKSLRVISERIPFLKDEANFTAAVNTILVNIEEFTLRNHYQEAGQESLRADKRFSALFREEFGDKAPYVEFLFYQLHETYPELPKLFLTDKNALESIRRAFKEAEAAGKEFLIDRG